MICLDCNVKKSSNDHDEWYEIVFRNAAKSASPDFNADAQQSKWWFAILRTTIVINDLIQSIFQLSPAIRYIAIYWQGELVSSIRDNLTNASHAESDKYEELIVNPTLLKLVTQRGNIDCGGVEYVLIRYGNFYQLVVSIETGHISVCIEPDANPLEIARLIQMKLSEHAISLLSG